MTTCPTPTSVTRRPLPFRPKGVCCTSRKKRGGEVRPLDCLPLFEAGLAEAAGILLTTASRRIWWAPASQAVPAPPSAAEPSPHSPPSEASPPLSLRRVGTR